MPKIMYFHSLALFRTIPLASSCCSCFMNMPISILHRASCFSELVPLLGILASIPLQLMWLYANEMTLLFCYSPHSSNRRLKDYEFYWLVAACFPWIPCCILIHTRAFLQGWGLKIRRIYLHVRSHPPWFWLTSNYRYLLVINQGHGYLSIKWQPSHRLFACLQSADKTRCEDFMLQVKTFRLHGCRLVYGIGAQHASLAEHWTPYRKMNGHCRASVQMCGSSPQPLSSVGPCFLYSSYLLHFGGFWVMMGPLSEKRFCCQRSKRIHLIRNWYATLALWLVCRTA